MSHRQCQSQNREFQAGVLPPELRGRMVRGNSKDPATLKAPKSTEVSISSEIREVWNYQDCPLCWTASRPEQAGRSGLCDRGSQSAPEILGTDGGELQKVSLHCTNVSRCYARMAKQK